MAIVGEDDNLSNNFGLYRYKKLAQERSDIRKDNIDLVSKSSDTKNYVRVMSLVYIPQDGLGENDLSLSLREVRFSD